MWWLLIKELILIVSAVCGGIFGSVLTRRYMLRKFKEKGIDPKSICRPAETKEETSEDTK